MNTFIEKYKKNIEQLCEKHHVKTMFLFGSVLTDKFSNNSDIDFIVDFDLNDPLDYTEHYFDLKFALEAVLKRKIDLLENKAIKNLSFKEAIDKTKIPIYASRNQSMA